MVFAVGRFLPPETTSEEEFRRVSDDLPGMAQAVMPPFTKKRRIPGSKKKSRAIPDGDGLGLWFVVHISV